MSSAASAESNESAEDKPKGYWLGFDLGGTKMQCALFNEKLEQLEVKRRRTKGEQGVEATLERIQTTIERLLDERNVSEKEIAGIGIGCPGPVEPKTGVVRVAVNLGWKNIKVGDILRKRFDCPVSVLNDVDAGVYGEYIQGAGKGANSAFGLFPGTGIGGGFVYNGQILSGRNVSCMEVGHIKICGSERMGATGMSGTLETEASRLSIAGELAKLAFRGEAPKLQSEVGTEVGAIRSKVIAEAIDKGDKEVRRVVENACEMLGYTVANMVLTLCPDCVILGGGLVEAMPDLFVREVAKVAKRHVFDCYRDEFEVKAAQLGDDAATVGAAAWAKLCAASLS